ncbi:ketopantoate reductase family protein [Natrinema caseinilyticum]|uniref:ketopantoate reductase family protein n=1 Tax=Natrinema caseinilyticum TaxID=2961570 RepID=UPI0020C334A3|nr:2-dehydropantoate 2-reductase [Natrinema caseinilyticum]
MKIAVIGAGALGCLYGGFLATAGHDVWLIHHRQSTVDSLNRTGIRIESDDGVTSVSVPATTDAAEVGDADLVLVFVKAHQTIDALEQHDGCIGPETTLLSLQNGLRHYDQLADVVGADRALAGVSYQGARIDRPGQITQTAAGRSVLGGGDPQTARDVVRILAAAGLPADRVDDPTRAIWAKQLVSLPVKPVAALTRLPNGQLVTTDGPRSVMERIVREAELVAATVGIDLPDADPMERVVDICRSGPTHRSSMLQDVLDERKTEIDEINGALVDIARAENVDVPANALVTELVRGLERSYLE